MLQYSELVRGKTYQHKDGRKCAFMTIHPDCGATLIMEEVDREDGEICQFFICERHDLQQLPEGAASC